MVPFARCLCTSSPLPYTCEKVRVGLLICPRCSACLNRQWECAVALGVWCWLFMDDLVFVGARSMESVGRTELWGTSWTYLCSWVCPAGAISPRYPKASVRNIHCLICTCDISMAGSHVHWMPRIHLSTCCWCLFLQYQARQEMVDCSESTSQKSVETKGQHEVS